MAFPILPLVLLGAGLFLFRRRSTSSASKKDTEATWTPIHAYVWVSPDRDPRPGFEPGTPCDAADGDGARDEAGGCKTFWIDGVTDEAIARLAREEWERRGAPGFSDLCLMVPDPTGGEFAPPKDNPLFVEIVAAALGRYYELGALFPPTEADQHHEEASPYWVHKAWARAVVAVRKELCGR